MYMEARWEGGGGRAVKVGILSVIVNDVHNHFIKWSKTEENSVAPGSSGNSVGSEEN